MMLELMEGPTVRGREWMDIIMTSGFRPEGGVGWN